MNACDRKCVDEKTECQEFRFHTNTGVQMLASQFLLLDISAPMVVEYHDSTIEACGLT